MNPWFSGYGDRAGLPNAAKSTITSQNFSKYGSIQAVQWGEVSLFVKLISYIYRNYIQSI